MSRRALTIEPPRDYLLPRDLCSYGYFLLAPNHFFPEDLTFRTTLDLSAAEASYVPARSQARAPAVTVLVRQGGAGKSGKFPKPGEVLEVRPDRALSKEQARLVAAMLTRMLRLDEPGETVRAFHALDPRWGHEGAPEPLNPHLKPAIAGRGRLMRSASFFEDVVKTVTSCNVTWPSTVNMNAKLCRVVGAPSDSGLYAFPTPERLARTRPATLRARCSVGYRDVRIVELAKLFARARTQERRSGVPEHPLALLARAEAGEAQAQGTRAKRTRPEAPDRVHGAHFELPAERGGFADEAMFEMLQEWPGIGPYAAANILQLLGRYSRLPLDTESVRHAKSVLNMKGPAAKIMKRLHKHYDPFGEHKFRAYWFELWAFYESKRGPAWTWERETTGKSFTASQL